jgi:hypothetical protein
VGHPARDRYFALNTALIKFSWRLLLFRNREQFFGSLQQRDSAVRGRGSGKRLGSYKGPVTVLAVKPFAKIHHSNSQTSSAGRAALLIVDRLHHLGTFDGLEHATGSETPAGLRKKGRQESCMCYAVDRTAMICS